MKQTVSHNNFIDAFRAMDRVNNFGFDGLTTLFKHLEEYEEETNEEIEFDVISLCCDYTQYDSLEDCLAEYDNIDTLEELQNHTTVIEYDGGVIIQAF